MRYVRDAHHRHTYTVRKAHETSALLRATAATAGCEEGFMGGTSTRANARTSTRTWVRYRTLKLFLREEDTE